MTMEEYEVNKNIRRIILKTGLKQGDVAEAAGISKAVFSNIVRCERKVYADEVASIAAALRIPVAELFHLEMDHECCNCKFWQRLYAKMPDGMFLPSPYGYCFKPGQFRLRKGLQACEKYQQRE